MDILALKLDLVEKILQTENRSVLSRVAEIFSAENDNDWWENLPPEIQQSILQGEEDIRNKNLFTHEQIVQETKSKYGLWFLLNPLFLTVRCIHSIPLEKKTRIKMQIIWSSRSKFTYFQILDYLQKNWTKREMIQFVSRTEKVLHAIKANPSLFPASIKHPQKRRATIDKNNSLYYQVDHYNQTINLLTFFDNRQHPGRLTDI